MARCCIRRAGLPAPRIETASSGASPRGQPATIFAGRRRNAGASGDGGPATSAQLSCPFGLATQPDGGVLIADVGALRVRRVRPDGIIETVAGSGRKVNDGDGGPALA